MMLPFLVCVGLVIGCPGLFPTPTEGTVAGTVTNSMTDTGVVDVSVTVDPEVEGVDITTDADGRYSAALPAGEYELTFERDNYESQTETVTVVAGRTSRTNVALTPTVAVAVSASVDGDAEPGATLTATATVEILDGTTTVQSYAWEQSNSVTVTLANTTSATASVTLPSLAVYKDELFMILAEPPISEEQLPPNVPLPETEDGEFPGGIVDRFYVLGLTPFSLEEVGLVTLEVTVITSAGDFTAEVEIHTELPWKSSPGLHNVPIGLAILLHGKTQDAYDWALDVPSGSSATLVDTTTQNPYFTPDVAGKYTVTVTDTTVDPAAEKTLGIYAGTWTGAISGQDAEGRPEAAACTVCHSATGIASDEFTPWAQTGHAEIFTDSLNTSDHYSTSCLVCHTVGYDPDVDNGGFDDADDYEDFLAAFTSDGSHFHAGPDNWDTALADTLDTAQRGNIQCENCHGPQGSAAHTKGDARFSISSDVCGVCHGEPLRHGRFQQWQLSAHANYELAIDEGEDESCSRCHTGNGFLNWLPVLLDDDPATDPADEVTVDWTADQIHPITCVVCHDPHSIGSTTGTDTDATVRITGDTPELIGGFTVIGAGNGAICMTCHNSRRGLRNDDTFAAIKADGDAARAPHGSAQTDVLVGQNAYLVEVGVPGGHALVNDTCVVCHMTATPPPDLLSYNQGGTNHTFFASADICAACHGELVDGSGVQNFVEDGLDELKELIEDALLDLITEQIDAGNKIDLDGEATVADVADIDGIEFGESHGRQGITVTLADSTVVGPLRLPDVLVLDAGDAELGELYDFADDRLAKAGWNWILLHSDGSLGVHNPGFAFEVLDASIDALEALADE